MFDEYYLPVPNNNATGISTTDNIVLTFDETVLANTGNIVISNGSDTQTISITDCTQITFSGSTVTINPASDLQAGSTYYIQIDSSAIQDSSGNLYAGISDTTTLDFTTAAASNNAPVITSNSGGSTASVSVEENQTAVTTVTSTDADSDTVTYSLTGGSDQAKFSIDSSTGVLTFASAPDFENPTDSDTNNTYVVEVTATDNGSGTLTDTQTITVTVTDANEAPVITSNSGGSTASVSVEENQTSVTTVTTTDADSDTVTYSLTGGSDQAKFSIDSSTGVLTFASAPDFDPPPDSDTNNTYVVEVTATDNGSGTLTDTQNKIGDRQIILDLIMRF